MSLFVRFLERGLFSVCLWQTSPIRTVLFSRIRWVLQFWELQKLYYSRHFRFLLSCICLCNSRYIPIGFLYRLLCISDFRKYRITGTRSSFPWYCLYWEHTVCRGGKDWSLPVCKDLTCCLLSCYSGLWFVVWRLFCNSCQAIRSFLLLRYFREVRYSSSTCFWLFPRFPV